MKKSTEALSTKRPQDIGVPLDGKRIVAVQGQAFWQEFIGKAVAPIRREVASMCLASMIQSGELVSIYADDTPVLASNEDLVNRAFALADAFVLAEKTTLVSVLKKYFDLYMERGDLDEVLKAAIDEATDFHL